MCTGARRSQLAALRWGDVDLETGQVAFLRALLDAKGGPVLRPTKTGRTYRVNLDRSSLEVLARHHDRMSDRAQRHGVTIDRLGFVFSNDPSGKRPWSPNRVSKDFIEYRNAAKVNCRLHDLRHFMATTTNGRHMEEVKDHLGHGSIRVTSDRYGHLFPSARAALAESLEVTYSEAAPLRSVR